MTSASAIHTARHAARWEISVNTALKNTAYLKMYTVLLQLRNALD